MPWVLLFDDFAHRRPFQEGSRWVPRFTNSGLLEGLKGRLFWISLQKTMVIRQDIKSFEFGTIEQCQLMLTYSFWILLYTSGRCCERISLRKKWSIFRRELARISLRWNKAFTMRKRWSQSWDSVRLLVCDLYIVYKMEGFFWELLPYSYSKKFSETPSNHSNQGIASKLWSNTVPTRLEQRHMWGWVFFLFLIFMVQFDL